MFKYQKFKIGLELPMSDEEEEKHISLPGLTKHVFSRRYHKDNERKLIIEDFKQSGLKEFEYARKNNLATSTLYRWLNQYDGPGRQKGNQLRSDLPLIKLSSGQMAYDKKSIIKEFKDSKLSVAQFCEMKNITKIQFYNWKAVFNRQEKNKDKNEELNKRPLFLPLNVIKEEQLDLPIAKTENKQARTSETTSNIEITINENIKLNMPKDTDINQIISIIKGLSK